MKQVYTYFIEIAPIIDAAAAYTSRPEFAAKSRKGTSLKRHLRQAANRVMTRLAPLDACVQVMRRQNGDVIELKLTLPVFPTGWVWFGTDVACAIAAEVLASSYAKSDIELSASFSKAADEICSLMFEAISRPQLGDAA